MLGRPLADYIATALIALIAMTVHEYAHARVAYAMGDPTAKNMGKMSLDPRANINWVGFAMFVIVGFGILGQVPVDERRMYNRRWGMLASVAAGPISNLLLAVVFAIPFFLGIIRPEYSSQRDIIPTLPILLTWGVTFNLLLFVFNLLPFFPLDGWTIVAKLLPPDLSYTWQRYRQESTYVLFGIIILSFLGIPGISQIFNVLIGQPIRILFSLLTRT